MLSWTVIIDLSVTITHGWPRKTPPGTGQPVLPQEVAPRPLVEFALPVVLGHALRQGYGGGAK